jgi:hypothetical protein
MRKGDLVKLRPDDPEIVRLMGWHKGPVKFMASRPTTREEQEQWREDKRIAIKEAAEKGEDTFSIAFDDGGESRLPPRSVSVPLPINRIYVVERARCRVQLGWGRSTGGMARILDTHTGEHAYVPREMLETVNENR